MIQPTCPAFLQDTYITGLPLLAITLHSRTTRTVVERHADIIAMKKQRTMPRPNQ